MSGARRMLALRHRPARDGPAGRPAAGAPSVATTPGPARPDSSAPSRLPAYMARDLPGVPEMRAPAVPPRPAQDAAPGLPAPSAGTAAAPAPVPAEAPAGPAADRPPAQGDADEASGGPADGAAPDAAAADAAAPTDGAPGGPTAAAGTEAGSGDAATTGAAQGRRRSRLAAPRVAGAQPVAAAPAEPTRGSVTLPRAPMLIPPVQAAFDAPGALDLAPERPPDPRREPPSREWLKHREVFADAIAAARRLYDSLLSDGSRFASAALAAEDRSAARRQSDLDADLARLAQGLDEARGLVRQTASESMRMLRRRAGGARARISRAATSALDALDGAKTDLTTRLTTPRADRAGIIATAATAQVNVTVNAAAATTALERLSSNAATEFPDSGGALKSAQNEAIAVRLPGRVTRRTAFFNQERGAQEALLRTSFATLGADFDQAFAEVDQLVTNVSGTGRTAVNTARDTATSRLDSAVLRLRRAIEQGAASTDAALVQQHEIGRRRLVEGAIERGRGETRAAARRAATEGEAVAALAGAQGKAIRAVIASLAPNRTQPAVQFARAVIGAATGMRARVAEIDVVQRARLARTASEGRAGQERQSRATAAAVAASAAGMARNLLESARQRAEQMRAETDQGSAGFPAMAEPVSASIASYMPPVGDAYTAVFTRLTDAISATRTRVNNVLTGTRGEGPPDTGGAPSPPPPSPPPTMAPNAFVTLAQGVATDPKTDERIADLITRSNAEVPRVIETKSTAAHDALGVVLSSNVEALMTALRAITRRQGSAIKEDYTRFGIGLEAQIRRDLPSSTSLPETNERNVNAAINYLNGNAVAGALDEMKAAVIWWNNEARVEAAQRNLSPAQMAELHNLHAGELADIGGDLDGADASVFNALGRVGEAGTDAERYAAVADADAVRLRSGITTDRDRRGDPGADAAVDRLMRSASSAGGDPIAGGDPLGLEEAEVREARRADTWLATQRAFGRLEGASAAEIANDPGAALVRFATAERTYEVFVPDDYPRMHDDMGPSGHWETRREGVSRDQARLIGMVVRENPGSTRIAGAMLAVEDSRSGRPRMDRLDMALHDSSLDAREGESAEARAAARPERERRARERRDEIMGLADQYMREGEPGPPRTPDQMRDHLADRMRTRFAGDASAIDYATSMVRNLEPDPQAGFRYALDHPAEREETFKRITGRMDRDQIDAAVAQWDANRGSRPTLYNELGLFQRESTFDTWWNAKLSGDARNTVEISFMGVPRNDLERAEVARHIMQQQVRDAGVLGPLFAHGDYARMVQNLRRLEREMGVRPRDIDRFGRVRRTDPLTGRPVTLGRFNERGEFVPGEAGSREAFESSIHLARLTAESYKATTDRVATAVTTGLVVIAAVLTTALTGGAAASIWIPVLVTAGAGLVGIGMSMAIKGDRYTRAEFERDLVMTIVQAATAGAGAAVGTAMRGGMPALRAAATRIAVADDVITGFANAAGRQGALSLTQEALIAGGTNAINSAAGAAMDPHNRMLGRSGEEAFSAGVRGFFGGVAGSVLMRPIMRAGVREPGAAGAPSRFDRAALRVLGAGDSTTRRALGSAFSSAGTRAAEIGVDRSRGVRTGSSEEAAGEIRDMFLQGLLQGALERRGEVLGDRIRARRAAARAASATSEPPAPVHEPPPPPPQRDSAVRLPPAVAEAVPAGLHGDVAEAARAARHAAPLSEPRAPAARPAPPPDSAVAPPPRAAPAQAEVPAPAHAGATEPPVPRSIGGDDEPTLRMRRPAPGAEDEPTLRMRRPELGPDDEPTLVRPRPEAEGEARTRRRPPPLPPEAREAARRRAIADAPVEQLPETTVMMPPNPKSRAEAEEMFHNSLRDDPSREVGLYVNSVTGEHVLVQGTDRTVIVAGDNRNPVGIAGEGVTQRWKELLDTDQGQWMLVAHNHPGNADATPDGWRTRLPSGRGGDFSVMMHESAAMGGATRHSKIVVTHEGRASTTEFAYDPSAPRPFAIIYDDPATGQRVFRRFKSLEGYGEFFERLTGVSPNIDAPSAPAATPRSEDLRLLHGTSAADAEVIRRGGIVITGKKGRADDFGAGFYVTLDTGNAEVYAADRAQRRTAGEGVQHVGEVLEFRMRLDELGVVVDVRPGGADRAAWEAFLAVPRGGPPDFRPTPPEMVARLAERGIQLPTLRDVISSPRGTEIRGAAFDVFLASIGMAHADAVRGDLGGVGTTGIHLPEGGEQIAIRTPEAAARLNAALRGTTGGGGEPPVPRAAMPPETLSAPPVPRSVTAAPETVAPHGSVAAAEPAGPAVARPRAPGEKIGGQVIEELVRAAIPHMTDADVDRVIASLDTAMPGGEAVFAPGRPSDPAERAAIQQRAIDATLDAMRARGFPPQDIARLQEMLAIGGAQLRRVMLAETQEGQARAAVALVDERLGRPLNFDRDTLLRVAASLRDRGVAEPLRTAARWSLGGMRPHEIVEFLGVLGRLEYDPSIQFGFGTHRRQAGRSDEVAVARARVDAALDGAKGVRRLATLRDIIANADPANRRHLGLLEWASGAVAGRGPNARARVADMDLVQQWHAYLAYAAARGRRPSLDGFASYVGVYNKVTQRPRIDEILGIELASQPVRPGQPQDALAMGLVPLRVPNDFQPNIPGIDSMGLRPSDGFIVIIDSKAHVATSRNGGLVSEVSAFFPNLIDNMRAAAGDLRRDIRAARAAGATVDPAIDAVTGRMHRCARELESAFPAGIDLSQPGAAAEVRRILLKHRIELVVTANLVANPVSGVAQPLRDAGVRFLRHYPPPRLPPPEEEKE